MLRKLVLGAMGLLAAVTSATAAVNVPSGEGFNWRATYEGDDIITNAAADPAWIMNNTTADILSVSNSILTYKENNEQGFIGQQTSQGGLWSGAPSNSTVEIRLKLDMIASSANQVAFMVFDGTKRWVMSVRSNGVAFGDMDFSNFVSLNTTNQFNVFRITREATGGKLYVNGDLALTSAGSASSANGILIDYETAQYKGQVEIDYIRWTNGGAFAPIPEPTTMGLWSAGGMLLLWRRRSRGRSGA